MWSSSLDKSSGVQIGQEYVYVRAYPCKLRRLLAFAQEAVVSTCEKCGRSHSDVTPSVPHGYVVGPLLSLLFVNYLYDALEALKLLFADDVKLVTGRTQNMNPHRSLTAAWDWLKKWDLSINPAKCNYLTIGREVPLRLFFIPDGSGTPIPLSTLAKDQGFRQIMCSLPLLSALKPQDDKFS